MDLNILHQAYKEVDEKRLQIAREILSALDGSQEDIARALNMRSELEEAEAKTASALGAYLAALKGDSPGQVVLKRSEYDRLPADRRSAFVRSGGRIVD